MVELERLTVAIVTHSCRSASFISLPKVSDNAEGLFYPEKQAVFVCLFVLFSHLHCCQDVVLRKSNSDSWGFSIVGGFEESKGNQPFFIKTIVPATPAFWDSRLKCVRSCAYGLGFLPERQSGVGVRGPRAEAEGS